LRRAFTPGKLLEIPRISRMAVIANSAANRFLAVNGRAERNR
jgi:hypothetical protein